MAVWVRLCFQRKNHAFHGASKPCWRNGKRRRQAPSARCLEHEARRRGVLTSAMDMAYAGSGYAGRHYNETNRFHSYLGLMASSRRGPGLCSRPPHLAGRPAAMPRWGCGSRCVRRGFRLRRFCGLAAVAGPRRPCTQGDGDAVAHRFVFCSPHMPLRCHAGQVQICRNFFLIEEFSCPR